MPCAPSRAAYGEIIVQIAFTIAGHRHIDREDGRGEARRLGPGEHLAQDPAILPGIELEPLGPGLAAAMSSKLVVARAEQE